MGEIVTGFNMMIGYSSFSIDENFHYTADSVKNPSLIILLDILCLKAWL